MQRVSSSAALLCHTEGFWAQSFLSSVFGSESKLFWARQNPTSHYGVSWMWLWVVFPLPNNRTVTGTLVFISLFPQHLRFSQQLSQTCWCIYGDLSWLRVATVVISHYFSPPNVKSRDDSESTLPFPLLKNSQWMKQPVRRKTHTFRRKFQFLKIHPGAASSHL